MVDRSYRVYVIQGQVERDWRDCQAAFADVPARVLTGRRPLNVVHPEALAHGAVRRAR